MGMSRVFSMPILVHPGIVLQFRVRNMLPNPDVGTVVRYQGKLVFVTRSEAGLHIKPGRWPWSYRELVQHNQHSTIGDVEMAVIPGGDTVTPVSE